MGGHDEGIETMMEATTRWYCQRGQRWLMMADEFVCSPERITGFHCKPKLMTMRGRVVGISTRRGGQMGFKWSLAISFVRKESWLNHDALSKVLKCTCLY